MPDGVLVDGRRNARPAAAANAARNDAVAAWSRALRWRPARTALWRLLDRHVTSGAAVAVVGAGNAHDVPLGRLGRRARHVDLIDCDAAALRRARRRALPRRPRAIVQDVTLGAADTITQAAANDWPPVLHAARGQPRQLPAPYDVVVADLLFTQLLYPALTDAGLSRATIGDVLACDGQALTDAVVARLHASAPGGLVIHVHDLLGWWPGHPQPFTLGEVLDLADQEPQAALELAQQGNTPWGCDARQASLRHNAEILDTAFWRWPFSPGVDYLVCATVAQSRAAANASGSRA